MKRRAAIAAVITAVLLVWWSSSNSDGPDAVSPTTTRVVPETTTNSGGEPTSNSVIESWAEDASQSETDARRDGINEHIARLGFSDRVDSVGTVTVEGTQWVLSRLPTDTRNRFVDEGLAGPELDPLGGELLLVGDNAILRAYPMNQFPPTSLATDGAFVYAARQGDGGYPDSALLAVNPRTLRADRIVMVPTGQSPSQFYSEAWEVGDSDQLSALGLNEYRLALRAIHSELTDGDIWTVRDDPDLGLCVTIGSIDYGCDKSDTVMYVATPLPPDGLDLEAIGILAYGYLPEGADGVEFYSEGSRMDLSPEVDVTLGIWAASLTVNNNPFSVSFIGGPGGETLLQWPED